MSPPRRKSSTTSGILWASSRAIHLRDGEGVWQELASWLSEARPLLWRIEWRRRKCGYWRFCTRRANGRKTLKDDSRSREPVGAEGSTGTLACARLPISNFYFRFSSSRQPILAPAQEFQQPQIAQNLELLADFVTHVAVLGMELREGGGVGVDVGESEFEFA